MIATPRRTWLGLLLLSGLAACTSTPPTPRMPGGTAPGPEGGPASPSPAPGAGRPPRPPLRIVGLIGMRHRLALPAGTVVVVELRLQADAPPLARQRIALDGRQLPVAFELEAPRDRLAGDGSNTLQAAVITEGQATWETEAVAIPNVPGPVDVGMLWLRPVQGAMA